VIIDNCRFADDVLYDLESNTWARFEEDGAVRVGVNTILAWLGGPITSVSVKPVGAVVERGKALGSVESLRHFDVVKSPVTGKILEVNQALAGNPRLLNHDPYGLGWFTKLGPLNGEQERAALKSPVTARADLQARVTELRVRCFAEFPDHEMYEIGTECSAVLVRLDELFATSPAGTVVHLVSDDPTSEVEMIRWSERTGNEVLEARKEGNLVHYVVKKTPH
jgi:glycine cleavage system H protein